MVHAECVFVAHVPPSRTWMSRSFESMQWIVCVHRLDLGSYSCPKEFWRNGVNSHPKVLEEWSENPMLTPKGKIPSTGKFSSEEDWVHDTASSRTASQTHYQRSYSRPQSPWDYSRHVSFINTVSVCTPLTYTMRDFRRCTGKYIWTLCWSTFCLCCCGERDENGLSCMKRSARRNPTRLELMDLPQKLQLM